MALMGRLLVTIAAAAALVAGTAGPAKADVLSDLGVSTEGLVNLPPGFDPLTSLDPLGIDLAIGLPQAPGGVPIDMTTKWTTNPPGQPITKKTSASSKKKKGTRKSRRARARRAS